jgi:iron-sulfur cluster repair protein YtfE (RIC family)
MKATELLKKQHDEVKAIFKGLEKGNGHTKALLEKLANNLAAHMVIEQELFYPAVLAAKEDLVLEGYEEHAVARFALKRLMKTEPSDRSFKATVTTLKELIEHHVEEEEEEMFPRAEKALGDGSEALCAEMKALFEKTVKAGYENTVGRGGAAVTSASAPAG